MQSNETQQEATPERYIPTGGEFLRTFRKANGWTLQDLAKKILVSQGYLSLVESSKRTMSADMRLLLQEATGLPSSVLPFFDHHELKQAAGLTISPDAPALAKLSQENRQTICTALEKLDQAGLDSRLEMFETLKAIAKQMKPQTGSRRLRRKEAIKELKKRRRYPPQGRADVS